MLKWNFLIHIVISSTYFATENFAMVCLDINEKNYAGVEDIFKNLKEIKSRLDDWKPTIEEKNVPMFDMRYDTLPEKCQSLGTYANCAEATACTRRSGYYYIKISRFSNESFLVECDAQTEGGDWTVIQRRQDGSVDFYRTWSEYEIGFGDIEGEFFIGLSKLHALTNYNGPQELLILMVNNTNWANGFAKYDTFKIGSKSEKYMLKSTGVYTGTAGDSLTDHIGMKFTTKDQDHDIYDKGNCAEMYLGAWWYWKCHSSNLNGHYGDTNYAKGVIWAAFSKAHTSLKYVKMMIRRRRM